MLENFIFNYTFFVLQALYVLNKNQESCFYGIQETQGLFVV